MPWQDEFTKLMRPKQDRTLFKLEEGLNVFRVLPNARSTGDANGSFIEESPMIRVFQHNKVGPKKRQTMCGKDFQGEGECWICDVLIPKLMASKKRSKMVLAKAISQDVKWVAYVAFQDQMNHKWYGPALWFIPGGGGDKSFVTRLRKKLQRKPYYDPTRGYNFTVEREGEGQFDTVYGEIEPDEEPTKVPKSIMEQLVPFDDEERLRYSKTAQIRTWKGEDARQPDEVDEEETESPEDGLETGEEEETGMEAGGEETGEELGEEITEGDEIGEGPDEPVPDEGEDDFNVDETTGEGEDDLFEGLEELSDEPEEEVPAPRRAAKPIQKGVQGKLAPKQPSKPAPRVAQPTRPVPAVRRDPQKTSLPDPRKAPKKPTGRR